MKHFAQNPFGNWTFKRSTQKIVFNLSTPGKAPFYEEQLPRFLELIPAGDRDVVLAALNQDQSGSSFTLQISLNDGGEPLDLMLAGTWDTSRHTVHGVFTTEQATDTSKPDVVRIMNVLKVISEISNFIVYEQNFEQNKNVRYSGITNVLGYLPSEAEENLEWWLSIVHPDDRQEILDHFYNLKPPTTNIIMNYRVRHKDGRWIYLHDRLRIFWHGDKMLSIIGCSEDVTGKYLAENAILQAKEAAEAANQTKTNFLANMSHELRTPLGAIVGFSELLQDRELEEPTKKEYLSTILKNSLHLADIVSMLIDVSKIESGDVTLREGNCDLGSLIEYIETRFSRKSKQSGLDFSVHKSPEVPTEIFTDQAKFRQILSSVIGNAIKFTKNGSVSVVFDLSKELFDTLSVQIKDSGIGIPEAHRTSIFEPFTQVDFSTVRQYGGTGLGLALARNFARLIGGDVRLLKSKEDEGSTFEILLPLRTEETERIALFSNTAAKLAILPDEKALALEGQKILVVEDIEDNFQLVRAILVSNGAKIEWSEHGFDALEKVRTSHYDLIIMDIGIPGIDGLNLTRILRHEGINTPIIALSAHVMPDTVRQSLEAGCNDHIAKPIDFEKLLATITKHAKAKR